MSAVIARSILFFGSPCILMCDAQCGKAWGITSRPKISLSDDPDDTAYLADHELDEAPVDPGTYEGGHGKPITPSQRLNKWCARQCERSALVEDGRTDKPTATPDFSTRLFNKPDRVAPPPTASERDHDRICR